MRSFDLRNRREVLAAERPLVKMVSRRRGGFTFTELVIVVLMVGLFVLMTQLNVFSMLKKSRFETRLGEFVSTVQMAVTAAAESDRRYEVIVDIAEQTYMLREITTAELSNVLEEEIIAEGEFGDDFWVSYVLFDDGDYTSEQTAKFRAGRSGWQYGGKIVFIDEDEQVYTVLLNRLSGIVELVEGEADMMEPRRKDEVPF